MKETELLSHIEAQLKTLEGLRDDLNRGGVAVSSGKVDKGDGSSGGSWVQGVTPEGETASEVTTDTDSWAGEDAVTPKKVAPAKIGPAQQGDSLAESVTRLKRAADADKVHQASLKNTTSMHSIPTHASAEVRAREDVQVTREREEARRNLALEKQRQQLQLLSAKKEELERQRLEKLREEEQKRADELAKRNRAARDMREAVQVELEAQRKEEERLKAQLRRTVEERRTSFHSTEKKKERERQMLNTMEFKRRMDRFSEMKKRQADEQRAEEHLKAASREQAADQAMREEKAREEALRMHPTPSFVLPSHKARQGGVEAEGGGIAASRFGSFASVRSEDSGPAAGGEAGEGKPDGGEKRAAAAAQQQQQQSSQPPSRSSTPQPGNAAAAASSSSQLRARFRILSQDVEVPEGVAPSAAACCAAACLLLPVAAQHLRTAAPEGTPTSTPRRSRREGITSPVAVPSPPPHPKVLSPRQVMSPPAPPPAAFSSSRVETLRSEVQKERVQGAAALQGHVAQPQLQPRQRGGGAGAAAGQAPDFVKEEVHEVRHKQAQAPVPQGCPLTPPQPPQQQKQEPQQQEKQQQPDPKDAKAAEPDSVTKTLSRYEKLTRLMREQGETPVTAPIPVTVPSSASAGPPQPPAAPPASAAPAPVPVPVPAAASAVQENPQTGKQANVMASIRQLRESANVSYRSAKYDEAARIYTKALQLHLKNPQGNSHKEKYDATIAALYLNRSASFMMTNSYQEALRDAQRAGDIEPKNPKPVLRIAKLHLFLGNPRQARTFYARGQKMAPLAEGGLAAIAPTLSSEIKALESCEAYVQHRDAAQWQQALQAAQSALEYLPCLFFQQLKCESLVMIDPRMACKELQRMAQHHPHVPDVLHLRAKALFYCGHDKVSTNAALQCLAEVLLLDASHSKARALQSVIASFEQLRDEGSQAYEAGNYALAHTCYTKALSLDPSNKHLKAIIVLNRAAVLLQQGSYDAALEDCNTSLMYDANSHKAYARRARCHHLLGNLISEIKDLKTAIRLHKGNDYQERLTAAEAEFTCRFNSGGAGDGSSSSGGGSGPSSASTPAPSAAPNARRKSGDAREGSFFCRGRSSFKRGGPPRTGSAAAPGDRGSQEKDTPHGGPTHTGPDDTPAPAAGRAGGAGGEPRRGGPQRSASASFAKEGRGGPPSPSGSSGKSRGYSTGRGPPGAGRKSPVGGGGGGGGGSSDTPGMRHKPGQFQHKFRKGFEFKGFNFKGYTTGGQGGGGGGSGGDGARQRRGGGAGGRFPHKPPTPPQPSMYEVLGVVPSSSAADIKTAYRQQAMRWHPDKCVNGTDEEKQHAEAKFKELSQAYATLSDVQKRRAYDMAKK